MWRSSARSQKRRADRGRWDCGARSISGDSPPGQGCCGTAKPFYQTPCTIAPPGDVRDGEIRPPDHVPPSAMGCAGSSDDDLLNYFRAGKLISSGVVEGLTSPSQ